MIIEMKGLNHGTFLGSYLTAAGVNHTYYVKPDEWTQEDVDAFNFATVQKFTEEAKAAGFDVNDYKGRFMYEGVAVITDEQDVHRSYVAVARATTVDLAYDACGLNKVVYPVLMTYPEPDAYVTSGQVLKELEVS